MEKFGLKNKSSYKKQCGFTLIEVLIAVAILAIALLAVTRTVGLAVKDNTDLRDKTLAHWVAVDVAAKVQMGLINVQAYSGVQAGTEIILNRTFAWQANSVALTDMPVLQVSVRVYDAKQKKQWNNLTLFIPVVELL